MTVGKNLKGIIDRDGVKHAVPAGGGGVDPSIPEQIAEKADKVNPELEGHLAAYDEDGNLGDGGDPSQFAAASHSHEISGVNGLQEALNEKAPAEHSHAIADVTGLQAALNGKVPYYNGQVIIKHKDDTIAYPVAGDDDVKNSLLALYNAIPDRTYVLCRVILDNSDYSGTQSDVVTVPALAYAEDGQLQDEWDVSILFANGVTFTAGQQGSIATFWSKKTSGFFS